MYLLVEDEIYDLESNPFIAATMAVSLMLIIVAGILLIVLLKQRRDNKRGIALFPQ